MPRLNELRERVAYSPHEIKEAYLDKNEALTRQVKKAFSREGISVRIQNVGSAAPERISLVRPLKEMEEVKTSDSEIYRLAGDDQATYLFIPDFDVDIITPEKVSTQQTTEAMRRICPYAVSPPENRFPTFYQGQGTYYITFTVLSEQEAAKEAPNRYASLRENMLTEEQALEARALKYLAMDNWAYGGWNQGLRGIAAEQLVKRYGNLEKVLEILAMNISDEKFFIPSPLSSASNLISNMSRQNRKRLRRVSWNFLEEGEVYGLTHKGYSKQGVAIAMMPCAPPSCGAEPHQLRKTLLQKINDEIKPSSEKDIDLCLVPAADGEGYYYTLILIAIEPSKELKKPLESSLRSLWSELEKHHSTDQVLSIIADEDASRSHEAQSRLGHK